MKENLMEVLLTKAKGYTIEEVTSEYMVEEGGQKRLIKQKVQSKHYPPDNSALKSYLEHCGADNKYEHYTNEQLEAERMRLIKQLKVAKPKKVKEAK